MTMIFIFFWCLYANNLVKEENKKVNEVIEEYFQERTLKNNQKPIRPLRTNGLLRYYYNPYTYKNY